MAYLPNVPQPTDQLNISQGNLLNNFQFLEPITEGILTFVVQTMAPPLSGTDIFQFARKSPMVGGTNQTEMCIERTSGAIVEFTSGSIFGSAGWSRFPSNLLMIWKLVTTFNFSTAPMNQYTFDYSTVTTFPGFNPADTGGPITFVTLFGSNTYSITVLNTSSRTQLVLGASTFTSPSPPSINVGFCWISLGLGPTT